jgi:hypothetical protein
VPIHDKLEPPSNMKKFQNNRTKFSWQESRYFSFEQSGIKFPFSRFLGFFEDKNKTKSLLKVLSSGT